MDKRKIPQNTLIQKPLHQLYPSESVCLLPEYCEIVVIKCLKTFTDLCD